MSPIAHFMGSWLVAAATLDKPRDRRLVTLAGILPDADGLEWSWMRPRPFPPGRK